jgi:uncharacterized protein
LALPWHRRRIGRNNKDNPVGKSRLWPRQEDEEIMSKAYRFAAGLGLGLLLASTALAQAPAEHTTVVPLAPAIPPDQQPTREQLAKLFEVMRLRQQLQSVMKAMPAMIQQQVKTQMEEVTSKLPGAKQLTPEQQAVIDKMMNKYMEKAFKIYPVNEMLDDMASIYQRHLSRSDVDAFIVFYDSPAGQHLLDAQPAIMQEYMPMVMQRTQERTRILTDEMAKDMEELVKSMAPAGDKPAQK